MSTFGSLVLLGFISLLAFDGVRSLSHRERLYWAAATNAEYFRFTVNSIGDGLIATSADKKITFINPVAGRLTGWTEEESFGTPKPFDAKSAYRQVHYFSARGPVRPRERTPQFGTEIAWSLRAGAACRFRTVSP